MKERQQYCPVCKKETRHVIAFYNSPAGWNCAEHSDLKHCCKCGKAVSKETAEMANKLRASAVVCDNCTPEGGTFA